MNWFKRRQNLAWFLHNVVAHPVSELCHWLGYVWPVARRWGGWLHDATVPYHDPGTGRG